MSAEGAAVRPSNATRRITRLTREHATLKETLRRIRDETEPEPWEHPSEVHVMASEAVEWAGDPMDVGA
ncbi:MAG: hypothetical protein ACOC9H_02835 [Gemmatimonadota bacterium]